MILSLIFFIDCIVSRACILVKTLFNFEAEDNEFVLVSNITVLTLLEYLYYLRNIEKIQKHGFKLIYESVDVRITIILNTINIDYKRKHN